MIDEALRIKIAPVTLSLLLISGCEVSSAEQSHLKIRSGQEVTWQQEGPEAKSTVGLIIQDSFGRESTCSAALIGPDLLVTAAHCVYGYAGVTAFFGLDRDTAIARRQLNPAAAVAIHPDYKAQGPEIAPHDIAVLKLKSAAPSNYEPIALAASTANLEPGTQVLLAGYGITELGRDSGTLRYTMATYTGSDAQGRLQINDPWRRGACSGDSGGPLYHEEDGRYVVAGVLSGGPIPCRGVNFYTAVAEHLDFVKEAQIALDH
ncbi:MAG: serine protease [Deltaproteobacteria bacterium]|nr:serine protease [Deltaproteobacteria bacterium]